MKIRKMLTEILLEVTNQEVEDVVLEAIEDEKSKKVLSFYVHLIVDCRNWFHFFYHESLVRKLTQ